jgi:hypothetical protein
MGQPDNYGLQDGRRISSLSGIKQALSLSRAQKLTIAGIRFSTPSTDLIQLLTPQLLKQPPPSGVLLLCHAAQGLRKCGVAWLA